MYKKAAVSVALLLAFSSVAAATNHMTIPDAVNAYGKNSAFEVQCDPDSGKCPTGVTAGFGIKAILSVCDDTISTQTIDKRNGVVYYRFDFDSSHLSCGYGAHSPMHIEVRKNNMFSKDVVTEDSGGSLTIEAKDMEPHRGEYLYVGMNSAGDTGFDLVYFFLSNEHHLNSPEVDVNPWVIATQYYPNNPLKGPKTVFWDTKAVSGSESPLILEQSETTALKTVLRGTGDCSSTQSGRPCDSVHEPFTKTNGWLIRSDTWDKDSMTPVNLNSNFYPQGEFILGNEPRHYRMINGNYKQVGGGGPYFYICRSGATMTGAGGDTPQVVNVSTGPELYQCDTSTNTWERTYECSDGLDNDGDHRIDYRNDAPDTQVDPQCNTERDNSEDIQICTNPPCEPTVCPTPVVGKVAEKHLPQSEVDEGDQKVALWNPANDGTYENLRSENNCQYDSKMNDPQDATTGEPATTYTCNADQTMTGYPYGPREGSDYQHYKRIEASNICGRIITSSTYSSHGDQVPVAEYYIPEAMIPFGQNQWIVDTSQYTGYANFDFQTLHQAEAEYSGGNPLHDASTWNDKGLVDAVPQAKGGDGYEPGERLDSWTTGNATGQAHPKIGDSQFPGGFAGKCPTGQRWQDTNPTSAENWECTGELPWQQQVYIPDVHNHGKDTTIGMFLMPINFQTNALPSETRSFWRAWKDSNGGDVYIEKVNAVCYAGTKEPDYSTASDSQYFTVETDIPRNVKHPIPILGTVDMTGYKKFTCEWYYTLSNGDLIGENDNGNGPGTVNFLSKTSPMIKQYFTADRNPHSPPSLASDFEDWKPTSYDGNGPETSHLLD